jgi:hypothetical protein
MRRRVLTAAATAVALAGCAASGPSRIDAAGPTVTYEYDDERELQEAGYRAAEWCGENYGLDARLVHTGPASYGNGVATFECVD